MKSYFFSFSLFLNVFIFPNIWTSFIKSYWDTFLTINFILTFFSYHFDCDNFTLFSKLSSTFALNTWKIWLLYEVISLFQTNLKYSQIWLFSLHFKIFLNILTLFIIRTFLLTFCLNHTTVFEHISWHSAQMVHFIKFFQHADLILVTETIYFLNKSWQQKPSSLHFPPPAWPDKSLITWTTPPLIWLQETTGPNPLR